MKKIAFVFLTLISHTGLRSASTVINIENCDDGFNTIIAFRRVEEATHALDALKVAAGRRFKNPNVVAGRIKDPNKNVYAVKIMLHLVEVLKY
ncbi:MAG: hypothetical protein GDA42_10415 [Ekhidna sp.]|nr:hypothetical protein [Ekhidna sp.]MBC6410847.1 hypothetical protein [Ekhidna sp.]